MVEEANGVKIVLEVLFTRKAHVVRAPANESGKIVKFFDEVESTLPSFMPRARGKGKGIAELGGVDDVDFSAIRTFSGEHTSPGVLTVKLVGGFGGEHNEGNGDVIGG